MTMHESTPTDPELNSLGFAKAPADTRVVVAMSGGVDSSVVAATLARDGYEVIGITLQLYDHGAMLARKGACCAGRDIHDARRISEEFGFPHYVFDYENLFREAVIDEFADSYLAGSTPVPCIRCNERVKFSELLEASRELGADCLATGHYIRRETGPSGAEMHCAADPARDQSYFLFSTTKEQLEFLRFPLGSVSSKAETRKAAMEFGLPVAEKPDSQDICFVPNGNYAELIKRLRPESFRPGDIVDADGNVLARHDGIIHYTVGQRRGLGIGGLAEPLYVVRLDPPSNRVVVGPKEALKSTSIRVKEVNWLGDDRFEDRPNRDVRVRVRSTRPPAAAEIRPLGNGEATVELLVPEAGISPGQACVFYSRQGSRVLGGGWIRGSG